MGGATQVYKILVTLCSVNGVQSVSTGFREGGVGGVIRVYKRLSPCVL